MNRTNMIDARDKPGFLIAMMKLFAGDDARLSLEGDLSKCDFARLPSRRVEPDGAFRRNTISPTQDYVIVPLTRETIRPILDQILPGGRCVHDIMHIEIEKAGELVVSACDNFHRECTAVSPSVPKAVLDDLIKHGVIRSHQEWSTGNGQQQGGGYSPPAARSSKPTP